MSDSIEFITLATEKEENDEGVPAGGLTQVGLLPTAGVADILAEGAALLAQGEEGSAAQRIAAAVKEAEATNDRAGLGRALAQLAALEESRGENEAASQHNRRAQDAFLEIGDGAGLVQTFRVDGFLHIRNGAYTAAAHCFAKALSLSLQLDERLVLSTLDQVVPTANFLVESDQVSALLPLGAALTSAVEIAEESAEENKQPALSDFAQLAATVAGVLTPLGVMADEPNLDPPARRRLAARSTHQAWHVDAMTKRRWGLAAMVKETLHTKLSFHEELD